MIRVINTLRANLIQKEIESKVHDLVYPQARLWDAIGPVVAPRDMFMIRPMLQRLADARRQRYASWRNNK